MESRCALIIRCRSHATLYLPFSTGQRHYFGRLRLRWQCVAEQKVSRSADRFVSRARTGLDGGTHAHSRGGIAEREKTLRGGGVSERMRENKFRHACSAETLLRLENYNGRRRHRVDANTRRPFVRSQSGEWLLRCRAGHELQVEPERNEIDAARFALHQRRPD